MSSAVHGAGPGLDPKLDRVLRRIEDARTPEDTLGMRDSQTISDRLRQYNDESAMLAAAAAHSSDPARFQNALRKLNAAAQVFTFEESSKERKTARREFENSYGSSSSRTPDGAVNTSALAVVTFEQERRIPTGAVLAPKGDGPLWIPKPDPFDTPRFTPSSTPSSTPPSSPLVREPGMIGSALRVIRDGLGMLLFSRAMDWTGLRSISPIIYDTEAARRTGRQSAWTVGKMWNCLGGLRYPDLRIKHPELVDAGLDVMRKRLRDGHEFGQRLGQILYVAVPYAAVGYFWGPASMVPGWGRVAFYVAVGMYIITAGKRARYERQQRTADNERAKEGEGELREELDFRKKQYTKSRGSK